MDSEQTLLTPDGSTDISNQLFDMTSSITDALAPFMLLSFVITVAFVVLYVVSLIRRRKLENALFDIQKTLHEMNERDKARSKPRSTPNRPESRNETIAASKQQPKGLDPTG